MNEHKKLKKQKLRAERERKRERERERDRQTDIQTQILGRVLICPRGGKFERQVVLLSRNPNLYTIIISTLCTNTHIYM